MPKKAKRHGKKQKQKKQKSKAKVPRAHEEVAHVLAEQNKSTQRASEDEKGRRLTVIMGEEAEMDKLWDRLKIGRDLQNNSSIILRSLEMLRQSLADSKKLNGQFRVKLGELEGEVEALVGRMKTAMSENDKACLAEHGICVSDLVSFRTSPVCVAEGEQAVTGFEEELSGVFEKIALLGALAKMDQ
ncbi:hypothetical protein LX32DRAFT_647914 [Colletotrichum zoysiae]|uniref:Uncharacterized protein n=1 Tax=Colletotrichum zoysiae TaxID=1216348 RepID=A0AAD9HTZ2_9PEZI|nr:hypothetical protein LX32DRAFT_647914 [Colletotrichum zoysiae]